MQSRSNKNYKGIDISSWQQGANLKEAMNLGYEIAIFKATEGVNFKDKSFETFYKEGREIGLKVGAYHFMSDITPPKDQARDFWNAIKDKKLDILPVLDIEKENHGRNKKQVTDRCIEFLEKFKELSGLDCIIYTYTSFINSYMDSRLSKYRLWIADYGKNDGTKQKPGENNVWSKWVGFQYTSKGRIKSFPSGVDLDEFTDEVFLNSNYKPSTSNKSCLQKAKEFVGDKCKELQELLIKAGYNCGGYGADGKFGQGTYNSLIDFQRDHGLTVDGLAGVNTFDKLKEVTRRKFNLIEQHGTCTIVVDKLNIREKPSVNSNIVGSYSKEEKVEYDYYVDNEGYRWISWIGASGKRRYMAVRVLSTNKRYGHCV